MAANGMARADGLAHAAQFKAPEPEQPMPDPAMEHLRLYQAKRAEWLQAKHDADVARKALDKARAAERAVSDAMVEAKAVKMAAIGHCNGCEAAAANLEAELLALVKGEQ